MKRELLTNRQMTGTATRLSTAARNEKSQRPVGLSINSAIRIQDRPTTQQGLGGLRLDTASKRNVQDKTYYIGILRNKVNEIFTEINRLEERVETEQTEHEMQSVYDQKFNQLTAENVKLKDQLSQYNTLLDKINSGETVGDIEREVNEAAYENHQLSARLDTLIDSRNDSEKRLAQLESQLSEENLENVVAEMDESTAADYRSLHNQKSHCEADLENLYIKIQSLKTKKEQILKLISGDPAKSAVAKHLEEISALTAKRDELRQEISLKTSPEKKREDLLALVRNDNQEISVIERQMEVCKSNISQLEEELKRIDSDSNLNMDELESRLYESQKRHVEIEEFLLNFPNLMNSRMNAIKNVEREISTLNRQIRQDREKLDNLPSEVELSKIRRDFQDLQGNRSETSLPRLLSENESLKAELEKLSEIQGTMLAEELQLKSECQEMEDKMPELSQFDRLKHVFDERRRNVEICIQQLNGSESRSSLKKLKERKESIEKKLNESPDYKYIDSLRNKLECLGDSNSTYKEAIAQKYKEGGLGPIKNNLLRLTNQYNNLLIERYESI